MPTADILDQLAAAVLSGDLTVHIDQTYSLDQAPQAIADFTAGKRGKLSIAVR